jgi:hypothetical protein
MIQHTQQKSIAQSAKTQKEELRALPFKSTYF